MRLLYSRCWCLIALIAVELTLGRTTLTTTPAVEAVSQTSSPLPPTCRSGSVNYITQTLPQQCVASNRTATTWQSSTATVPADPSATSTYEEDPPASSSSETRTETFATQNITSQSQSSPSPSPSATQLSTSLLTSATADPTPTPQTPADSELDNDQDSPLDKANFLSFEEWRRKNLEKAGQSPEHVGQQRSPDDMRRRSRPDISNALDVLGEDSEIELDFSGFGAPSLSQKASHQSRETGDTDNSGLSTQEKPPSQHAARSKDAGRTCKERTNYASFDCAASVLKTNPECKSASSVLLENKDSYMLNICKVDNKFFIVDLCDAILIDTVVLANYEFFSSIFRTFRLSVSDRYPIKPDKWRDLGIYEARNTREVQAFLVEEPLIWAHYLRVEILTHYGNEYYCPVSLLRVHGTTMMEEFRHQEEIARGDYQEDEAVEEVEGPPPVHPLSQEPPLSSIEAGKPATSVVSPESFAPVKTTHVAENDIVPTTATLGNSDARSSPLESREVSTPISNSVESESFQNIANSTILTTSETITSTMHGVSETDKSTITTSSVARRPNSSQETNVSPDTSSIVPLPVSPRPSTITSKSSGDVHSTAFKEDIVTSNETQIKTTSDNSSSTASTSYSESSVAVSPIQPVKAPTSSQAVSESSKRPTHTANGAQPVPSTQESFFKSIHKRLQMLESNATLSLQYIEEQSRILRDAFAEVEKRQVRKTQRFLESLNATVNAELRSFRTEYDQLWQSTVIELETHRRLYQQEILAVSSRLNLVAEELLFQKRMAIVQSTLLVLCVALVLFHRAGPNALDLPILHQMLNKSPLLRGPLGMYSPPGSPPDPSDKYRRSFWRRSLSPGLLADMVGGQRDVDGNGDEVDTPSPPHAQGHTRPGITFQPPTPSDSHSMTSDGDDDDDDGEEEEEEQEEEVDSDDDNNNNMFHLEANSNGSLLSLRQGILNSIERDGEPPLVTQSGPATPTGTRESPLLSQGGSAELTNGERVELGST